MKQTNQKIWRISSVLTLILSLFVSSSKAQPILPTIPNGTLTAFPVNFQLYPRQIIPDVTPDFGVVTVAGSIQSASGFTSLALRVSRDDIQ
ncbi:MAG: hypothetical protein KAF40_10715, partial [Flavihumibacter sp.]|nr:hypothetical protein [Flavihumibacter sp.]